MKRLQRLAALEGVTFRGWEQAHQIIQEVGQSQDEAIDAYGREKIGPNDLLIVRKIIEPNNGGFNARQG